MPRPTNLKINKAYKDGYDTGLQHGLTRGALDERKKMDDDLKRLKDITNTKAVQEITNLCRANAQLGEALCRALFDGRGM